MSVAAEPKLMTLDEFLALPDAVGYELLEGVLTERKPMGALADYVAQKISYELNDFCRRTRAGHVFGAETTYRCFGDPHTGRRADVSFVRRDRMPQIPEETIEVPADLAVEVISPHDLAYEVEEKVALYLNHGFGQVWVVYPNTRTVRIHRPDQPIESLGPTDTLVGRGPLEGFTCPVARFFPEM